MKQRPSNPLKYVGAVLPILALGACAPQAPAAAPPAASPMPEAGAQMTSAQLVMRGRTLVLHHACGDCHGGYDNPAAEGWLSGWREGMEEFEIGPFTTYPRNLTPDNATGLGRFSERQIFNALRFGLRPGETPDAAITSTVPGQGNFPTSPKYLAPPMPWIAFRHLPDEDLRAIAAYLKRGLQPVTNRVPDSEGPPDFWASGWADIMGTHPAPAFPTATERRP